MFEDIPPSPETTLGVIMEDVLSFKMPSIDDIFQSAWDSMWEMLVPHLLLIAVLGGVYVVSLFLLRRLLAFRAMKFLVPEPSEEAFLRRLFFSDDNRIDERMEFSFRGVWATIRRPYTQAACWRIAGISKTRFEELLAVSKNGERFGERLSPIADKLAETWEGNAVAGWQRVMAYADRPEVHEVLAAPGYTLEASLVSVEQDIPLEYAEALV